MIINETTILSDEQKLQIMNLWNAEYPAQLRYADIAGFDSYLNNLVSPHHLLAINDSGTLLGWAFAFNREGERWFAIIIDSSAQRQGIGSILLDQLKQKEPILNGWVADHDRYVKQNGQQYHSPLGFYLKNGFTVINETRLEIEILSAVKIVWYRTA